MNVMIMDQEFPGFWGTVKLDNETSDHQMKFTLPTHVFPSPEYPVWHMQ